MSSIKLKRFVNIYTGNSISDNDKEKYTKQNKNTIPYISTKDIELGSNKVNYFNDMYIDIEENKKFKIANKGDILLCIEGGSAGKKIARLDYDVCFVNKLCCFKGSDKVYNDFLYYYLQSDLFLSQFNLNMSGLIGGVSQSLIKEFNIPLLSKERQKKIANYLDDKVFLIDETIENNKKEIELLEEYKYSSINKKLNNCDWKNVRIKNTSYLKGRIGWQGLTTNDYKDEGAYLITGTDFENGKIKWDTCVHISEERYEEDKNIHIKEGDLLITKDGTIGKLAIVDKLLYKTTLNSGVMLIRANNNTLPYDNKYLYYVLKSNLFWNWYESNQKGNATIKHLYQEQFYNFQYPLPAINIQKQIVNDLDKMTSKIDEVIEYRMQIIEKLEEYKTSLIYEAVTGKIEV
mgnify:CR=1 FL=1